jgi:hypothetical protein
MARPGKGRGAHTYPHLPLLIRYIQAYLDYAMVMMKVPDLRVRVQDQGAVPDASETAELEELVRNIPKLLGILPDLLRDQDDPRHRAALAEMTANLTRELDLTRPSVMVSTSWLSPKEPADTVGVFSPSRFSRQTDFAYLPRTKQRSYGTSRPPCPSAFYLRCSRSIIT